jgi:hypothetical protein
MLFAGAHEEIITPQDSQFLFGYPHVKRYSEGVHDHLKSSALYLEVDGEKLLFIANDIIFITKQMAATVREAISQQLGIPGDHVMVSATHTHSGPITVDYASSTRDQVVPKTDPAYVAYATTRMVKAAFQARANAEAAVLGFAKADSTGIGTNRRDSTGPADHEVPVMVVMNAARTRYLACMLVVSMHPTVLHEDSKLVSADFPGMARDYLKDAIFGKNCVVLHHTGPCGNQSPRHVVSENTFAEAKRLGTVLGKAVEMAVGKLVFDEHPTMEVRRAFVEDPPRRQFPALQPAKNKLNAVRERMHRMKEERAPWAQIRTVECDIFGAEEMVTLSTMAKTGELDAYYSSCLPFEIQAMRVGSWWFVGWSGELFVDFALDVKRRNANAFIVSMANGENQGYITTEEAAEEGGYEASNALFPPEAGHMLVDRTLRLLADQQ